MVTPDLQDSMVLENRRKKKIYAGVGKKFKKTHKLKMLKLFNKSVKSNIFL